MKTKLIAISLSLMVCLTMIAGAVNAQIDTTLLGQIGTESGQETGTELPTVLGNIIRIVLGFLGVVLLGIVLYGGFLYMTSGGAEDRAKKGKSWITNGIIGLLIILAAYAITSFVIDKLTEATTG